MMARIGKVSCETRKGEDVNKFHQNVDTPILAAMWRAKGLWGITFKVDTICRKSIITIFVLVNHSHIP